MQRARIAVVGAVLTVALAGCTGGDAPAPSPSSSVTAATPTAAPTDEAPAVEPVHVEGLIGGEPVEMEVGPFVREGELGVLHVQVHAPASRTTRVNLSTLGFVYKDLKPKPNNLRLVDLTTREVHVTAETPDGETAAPTGTGPQPGESVLVTPVFAAPATDTTAVLVPYVGLVHDVPVVDSDDPAAEAHLAQASVATVADGIGADVADLTGSVVPATAHRVLLGGDVTASESDGAVEVAIASDVLFAVDSATLSGDADAALEAAAAQIAVHPSGALEVVGHTDDVAGDAYNQTLSERRAQAVADRLADVVDLGAYEVTVTGKGESEPAVEGTSADARRLNRRVELRFTPDEQPTDEQAPAREVTGELPPAGGPEGAHPDGVTVELRTGRTVEITVVSLERVDGVIVGTLDVALVGGGRGPVSEPLTQVAWDSRGEFAPTLQFAATGVTLLSGDERVFPLDHPAVEGSATRHPVADMILSDPVEPGQSVRATVVWPDVGGDSLVLDVPLVERGGVEVGTSWRLSDVPVTER